MPPISSPLPVELNRHIPSPNDRQTDSKDVLLNKLAQSKNLFEEDQLVRSNAGVPNSQKLTATTGNECEARPAKLGENDTKKVIVGEDVLALESDVSLKSNAPNSMRMSSEEILMVPKHYGLQYYEEIKNNLLVDVYFGSACSWPWQIIYYRRLKKGPVSAENHALRIGQNQEFHIVD